MDSGFWLDGSQTDISEAMRKLEVQQNGHSLGIAEGAKCAPSKESEPAKNMTQ